MKKQLLILLTAVAAVAAGCKKDKDKDNNPDNNNGKVKYLSKVTETDQDEIKIYLLTYDNNNRLVSYNSQDNNETKSYTYDANGNLTKVDSKFDTEREVYEVAYTNGIPTTGTRKTYEGQTVKSTETIQYTVANGKVSKIVMKADNDEPIEYVLTYQNGNLSKMEVISEDASFSSDFTYGTKKSPMYASLLKYIISPGESLEFSSKNELLTTAIKIGDNPAFQSTSVFTYDNDGYPLTGKSRVTGEDHDTVVKFEYK
nr:hypothetical protein [Pedobacter panaciterrae]